MNKEYIYINGKVIVEDEKGQKEKTEYYDNIEEVLIQENVIEQIENEIQKINEEMRYSNINKKFDKILIISSLIITILFTLGLSLSNTITTSINFIESLASCFMAPILGGIITTYIYAIRKNDQKINNAQKIQIELLEKRLEEEKNKLNLIKKINNKEIKEEFYVEKIYDKKVLEQLKKEIQLYYTCAYNENKFNKYYQNNQLQEKLENKYSDDEIELIKDYLKEKQLTKKY